jgi:hypothetical protein
MIKALESFILLFGSLLMMFWAIVFVYSLVTNGGTVVGYVNRFGEGWFEAALFVVCGLCGIVCVIKRYV